MFLIFLFYCRIHHESHLLAASPSSSLGNNGCGVVIRKFPASSQHPSPDYYYPASSLSEESSNNESKLSDTVTSPQQYPKRRRQSKVSYHTVSPVPEVSLVEEQKSIGNSAPQDFTYNKIKRNKDFGKIRYNSQNFGPCACELQNGQPTCGSDSECINRYIFYSLLNK